MRIKIFHIFCSFFLATSLIAGTHREKFQETYSFEKGSELIVDNTNGSVYVESWDRNEVRIEAEKIVKARSRRQAEEIMERVRIEVKQGRNYLEIRTKYPKRRGGFWDSVFGNGVSISVKYRILVPNETNMDISTVNGKVGITDVAGNIRVKTTNGGIEVREGKGSVQAKTTNGGIDVELLEFEEDEDMNFRTTNGSIRVYFPENLRADIDARTTNGSVRTDFPIEVRGKFSKRRLKGKINGGGGRIVLHTTNGGIKILEQ